MNRSGETFFSSLSQAVRDNPVAAVLIGGGALWFMFGNRMIGSAAGGGVSAVRPLADRGMRGASGATDAMTRAGGRAGDLTADAARSTMDATRSMTRAAGDAASSGASAIKEGFSDAVSGASHALNRATEAVRAAPNPLPQLQKGYTNAESALTDLFDRQPLVLGALGLAIGAGMASAFASTSFENEWAGRASDDLKEAAKDRAEDVVETARRAAGEIGSDFRAAASDAADSLRKTSEDAAHTVRETADAGRA